MKSLAESCSEHEQYHLQIHLALDHICCVTVLTRVLKCMSAAVLLLFLHALI